jgi:Collagen triple helix repeat (20 copies)
LEQDSLEQNTMSSLDGFRSSRFPTAALIGLIALTCLPLFAQAPPSADTFVSSAFSKTNFGSVGAMNVGPGSTSYVQFNLSGIPSGATVTKATLRLYVDLVISNGTFDVYQVNKSWSEGALTYNNQPLPLGVSATGGHPVSVTSSSFNQFLLIDVTSLVQGWVGATIPNNGVALALPIGSAANFYLDSKESLLTANGPELEIALAGAAGPQGPQGPQGTQGPSGAQGAIGHQGPAGAQGPQGLTGATGVTGATGSIGPMGLAGPQGPAGTDGTGFDFRTAFDPAVIYATNDVVTYHGSTYVAIAANGPSSSTPDVNSAWTIMAQQGATGAAGATGTQGPFGLTGATGPQGLQGFTGLTGPQGPQGATGPQGPAGTGGADPNSRMIFPTFFPGNLSGTWIGGQFVLDQAITVLRIAATAKTPTGASCPAAVFRFTDGTKGQDLVLTPGQNWSDTGSIQLTFAAGATLQASLRTGSACGVNAAGADANLLVEYKMQAAGDADSCPGPNRSCGTFCTNTSLDPANCGNCGTTCPSGLACANGACAGGETISCNTAADCPAEPNTTSPTCVSNKCSYAACTLGFNDCDLNVTNGCECVGGCAGSACATVHSNGVGQTYTDAFPLGTYTSATATEAATAYEISVGGTAASVSDGWQCGGTGPTFVCATDTTQNPVFCWGYSGSIAGKVSNGNCPFSFSTWK